MYELPPHISICVSCVFLLPHIHLSGERTLFYSYHVYIIEIYWMLFFDIIRLKGKSPVTCNTDPFFPWILKTQHLLGLWWNKYMYIFLYVYFLDRPVQKKLARLKIFPYDFDFLQILKDSRIWECGDLNLNGILSNTMPTSTFRSCLGKAIAVGVSFVLTNGNIPLK